jgi:SPP1 family predicted phage head-tail adaptor
MRAGNRRSRVSFYRPTVTGQTASGEDTVSSVLLGTAWVQVEAITGSEREVGQQLWAEARFRIVMEHPLSSFALQRSDTIEWGTRTLDILDCEDQNQRRREVRILAKEHTS